MGFRIEGFGLRACVAASQLSLFLVPMIREMYTFADPVRNPNLWPLGRGGGNTNMVMKNLHSSVKQ